MKNSFVQMEKIAARVCPPNDILLQSRVEINILDRVTPFVVSLAALLFFLPYVKLLKYEQANKIGENRQKLSISSSLSLARSRFQGCQLPNDTFGNIRAVTFGDTQSQSHQNSIQSQIYSNLPAARPMWFLGSLDRL